MSRSPNVNRGIRDEATGIVHAYIYTYGSGRQQVGRCGTTVPARTYFLPKGTAITCIECIASILEAAEEDARRGV